RTPTPLRVHGPEPCASANSATSALKGAKRENLARRRETTASILSGLCDVSNGCPKQEASTQVGKISKITHLPNYSLTNFTIAVCWLSCRRRNWRQRRQTPGEDWSSEGLCQSNSVPSPA